MPAASEFYGPLSATGGQRRAEPEAPRARQLQPLVRQPAKNPSAGMRANRQLDLRHAATELAARTCGKLQFRRSAPERRTVTRRPADRNAADIRSAGTV